MSSNRVPTVPAGGAQPSLDSHADEPFIVFGRPDIHDEEIDEVVACLRSGWIGTGPRVARFERDFARFKRAPHTVAVASCTAGLHLALLCTGLRRGDEIITSPLTFASTVNAIIHAGATPVLADVDAATMNLDPRAVAAAVTPRTRALLPVHFAGRPCAMDELGAIASHHGLHLVEDCAHAIEARYHGTDVGTFGDFGCFSFYATKNVTTAEGGMVIARDAAAAARIRSLSRHGLSNDAWGRLQSRGYEYASATAVGFKYNMTDLQAALGIHQLARVLRNWRRRRAIWSRYVAALRDLPVTLPAPPAPDTRHALHLFTLLVDETRTGGISRDAFITAMTARGIGVGVHYPSVAAQPVYRERFGWRAQDWPVAERIGRQTVSLPLSPSLTDLEVERVVRAAREALRV